MNAQAGNPDRDIELQLGECIYEGNHNQIVFPMGVYMQVAMSACQACNLFPTKGDLSGSLTGIRLVPEELFQDLWIGYLKQLIKFLEIFRQKIGESPSWLLRTLMQLFTRPSDLTGERQN